MHPVPRPGAVSPFDPPGDKTLPGVYASHAPNSGQLEPAVEMLLGQSQRYVTREMATLAVNFLASGARGKVSTPACKQTRRADAPGCKPARRHAADRNSWARPTRRGL
jgi:hypothetical protein